MKTCPECAVDLKPRAKSCACGWKAPEQPKPAGGEGDSVVDDHRCAWESGGDRCRYFGTIGESRRGPMYCRAHYGCADGAFGALVVEESKERMRGIGNWSAKTANEMARRAYLQRQLPPLPPDGERRGGGAGMFRSVGALARRHAPLDPEAAEERAALQDVGR
jgi:hypothetical protein